MTGGIKPALKGPTWTAVFSSLAGHASRCSPTSIRETRRAPGVGRCWGPLCPAGKKKKADFQMANLKSREDAVRWCLLSGMLWAEIGFSWNRPIKLDWEVHVREAGRTGVRLRVVALIAFDGVYEAGGRGSSRNHALVATQPSFSFLCLNFFVSKGG